MYKIASLAGTPVDSQMGADYLASRGIESFILPCTDCPRNTHLFQMKPYEEQKPHMDELIAEGKEKGAQAFFVYCNSLSAAFDFNEYKKGKDLVIVTPFDAYARLSNLGDRIGVVAANCLATRGIEAGITAKNPDVYVFGTGLLNWVELIEAKTPPAEMVEKLRMKELMDFYEANGAKAVILGCTHFPYFKEELEKITDLPIINPADTMLEIIKEQLG